MDGPQSRVFENRRTLPPKRRAAATARAPSFPQRSRNPPPFSSTPVPSTHPTPPTNLPAAIAGGVGKGDRVDDFVDKVETMRLRMDNLEKIVPTAIRSIAMDFKDMMNVKDVKVMELLENKLV